MIRIAIAGDFRALHPEKIIISQPLQSFLKSNHINAINFEAPVAGNHPGIKKSGPLISQSTQAPSFLESAGFNLISLANNHMMDFGSKAMYETISYFKSAKVTGAGDWENAYKMKVIVVDNKKIGFLALTHYEFGTLADVWDKNNTDGCAWINSELVDDLIIQYKKEVDVLIILAHGGVEYLDFPIPEWRNRYKQLIARGADAVIASHPHVPQGWEEHMGKPIFYSLGNWCFQKEDGDEIPPYWNNGLIALLELDDDLRISYSVKSVKYENSTIDFDESKDMKIHLDKCVEYLADDEMYMSKVNEAVIDLLPMYNVVLKMGTNAVRCDGTIKSFFRFFKRSLFHKEEPEHFANLVRCESHRWSIQRALKLLNNLT